MTSEINSSLLRENRPVSSPSHTDPKELNCGPAVKYNDIQGQSQIFQRLEKVQTKIKAATGLMDELGFESVNYSKYQN